MRTTINGELFQREHDWQPWSKVSSTELTELLLAAESDAGYRLKWAVLDEKIKAVRAMLDQAKAESWQHVPIAVVSALVGTPEQPIHQSEWRDDDLWHCINGEWIAETDLKKWCANNMDRDRYVDVVRLCHIVAYAGRQRDAK